jgi:transcriptional regulator with XRE-family HTH domain
VANDTAKRLLARVRELREARGLSQEAFAERAGLKYKHYQAIEAGRKINIQFLTLQKLAKACGLELSELLRFDTALQVGEDPPPKEPVTPAKRRRKH